MWEKNFLLLNEDTSIQFNGRCTMSSGVSLILDLGTLEIGKNFFCNKNCTISCNPESVKLNASQSTKSLYF